MSDSLIFLASGRAGIWLAVNAALAIVVLAVGYLVWERRDGGLRIPGSQTDVWPRLVFGLTVLAAGVLFWLDRIGSLRARDYLAWWPMALIALGIAYLPQRRWVAAAMWLIIGTYFLLPLMGVRHIPLWRIIGMWPLLISAAGVTLVLQALRRGGRERGFQAVAVMAGNNRRIGSQQFAGGEAVAVMGGCEIDLTSARIADEAVIDVLAFWGGIEIKVPRNWRVIGEVSEILGGFENKTHPASDSAPRLIIRGSAIMGGIEVRNAPESAV